MGTQSLYLHTDSPHRALDIEELTRYLRALGFKPLLQGDVLASIGGGEELAGKLAGAVLKELGASRDPLATPGEGEVLSVYDGYALAELFSSHLPPGLHIIYTSRMMATFEGTRYHGRAVVMRFPLALISTTGVVEAPAKPREYYANLLAYSMARRAGFEVPTEEDFKRELERTLGKTWIDYEDSRMTEAVKGYTLQALFYLYLGEPFCTDRDCRLYNAHTQKELLHAQVESGRLCKRHVRMLKEALQKDLK